MTEKEALLPDAKWVERNLTAPFHRTVLARYKCALDLYEIDEDDCGGMLRVRADVEDMDAQENKQRYFEFRYGFRHLIDGRICVVAWIPDDATACL